MRGRVRAASPRRVSRWSLAAALLVALASPLGWATAVHAATQGQIAHSADGVRLRSEPAYGSITLGLLPAGAPVDLRIDEADTVFDADGETRWWPVSTALGDGWVAGFFLEIPGWENPAGSSQAAPATGGEQAPPTPAEEYVPNGSAFARVAEPDGVNLRADPGLAAPVVQPIRVDTVVELRIDVLDTVYADGARWWPVAVDGVAGWLAGDYLAPVEATAEPEPPAPVVSEAPATSAAEAVAALRGYVQVVTDDGAGLNIRADPAPDAERVGGIPELDVVQVMEGPSVDPLGNGWYLVTDGGTTGWVFGDYLKPADQPPSPDGDEPEPAAAPAIRAGAATGSFMYPVERFTFTQGFGCSQYWWFYAYDPWAGCHVHDGIDLAAAMYTPVVAADGGTVDQAGWCDCGLGYYVKLDHGNGFTSVYGHLAEWPPVAAGQAVGKGDLIGFMGSTGSSTGPHLHFSMQMNGVAQDPLWYLP